MTREVSRCGSEAAEGGLPALGLPEVLARRADVETDGIPDMANVERYDEMGNSVMRWGREIFAGGTPCQRILSIDHRKRSRRSYLQADRHDGDGRVLPLVECTSASATPRK